MSPILVFSVIAGYFALLILISYLTSLKSDSQTFFTGNRKSRWYLVAFGMIGASLSGVTFISVPGWVGTSNFGYFQMVLGYIVGYLGIMYVLLPIFYKLEVVSIYSYLEKRFGKISYKAGSFYFLLSRTIGAAFRLFLVAGVLQIALFDALKVPFVLTVVITIALIWVYTFRSGIKTIVWTDTLQTTFMLVAVVVSITIIGQSLNLDFKGLINTITEHSYSQIFHWEWKEKSFFPKQFIGGAFMAFAMTGLDQDMMQKNLTCRNTKESQKNILWFSLTLLPVNLLFLSLGVLLYVYAQSIGLEFFTDATGLHFMFQGSQYNPDDLYPILAVNHLSLFGGIVFLLGIIAAAFSSADSALTSLTTAFSIDFLNINIKKSDKKTKRTKNLVHLGVSVVIVAIIVIFKQLNNESVVSQIFSFATLTYGPLLGLFVFGLITKLQIKERFVPIVVIVAPVATFFINKYSALFLGGYKFGFEILALNGLLTFLGLLIISHKKQT